MAGTRAIAFAQLALETVAKEIPRADGRSSGYRNSGIFCGQHGSDGPRAQLMTVDNVGQLALRCYRDRILRRSEERSMGDVAVLSAMIGAAGIGLLLGLSLKVSAVLAASAAIAVVGATIAPFTDVSAVAAALTTFGSLFALQCGYLGGLALSCVWSRVRGSSLPARESTLSIGRWVPDRPSSQAG